MVDYTPLWKTIHEREITQYAMLQDKVLDNHTLDWIHFTGSDVKNILRQYGFPDKERIFQVGSSNEYERIFKRIIIELQRCQDNYEEMLVLLLRHLKRIFT